MPVKIENSEIATYSSIHGKFHMNNFTKVAYKYENENSLLTHSEEILACSQANWSAAENKIQ